MYWKAVKAKKIKKGGRKGGRKHGRGEGEGKGKTDSSPIRYAFT